ncbi:MAG: 4-hydroxy-tetrahydrodipicolinate reductase [Flavobacteriales bacterium]|nr:4-hydroxy-tetrahydrodipicolinate reductase [Flavobacteriales bacterium]
MKIALYGYGKMGQAIEMAAKQRGHSIVLKVDRDNAGTPPIGADVAIEFSRPENALPNMHLCLEAGVPIVVGTTGWYDELGAVKNLVAQAKGTLLWASNFSIGVNLFFKLNKYLAALMDGQGNYAASIQETHHVHKLDAPSGTAITLARDIHIRSNRYAGWELKKDGHSPAADQVPITSDRIGEVPGTHAISWESAEDKITITHEAYGRQGFATGAVVAAEWLKGRTGLFTMDDVLSGTV